MDGIGDVAPLGIERLLHELQEDVARLGLAKLEGEALLVARVELPVDLHVLRAPRAQRIARRGLDLDHLRAEIREKSGERVARDEAREIEDAHAVEGAALSGRVVAFLQHGLIPA